MKQHLLTRYVVLFLTLSLGCNPKAGAESRLVPAPQSDQNLPHGVSVGTFNISSLYRIPLEEDDDPLEKAAGQIRKLIDPTQEKDFNSKYKQEYVDYITEIYSDYERFWGRIPLQSRRWVDFDNDGIEEYVVLSVGLNKTAWGFHNFFAVLGQKKDDHGNPVNAWEIEFIHLLTDSADHLVNGLGEDMDSLITVTDMDRDLRPDIFFTTGTIGGSRSYDELYAVSLAADMEYKYHSIASLSSIRILEEESIRPIFVIQQYDSWKDDDCGASVAARGPRNEFYKWSALSGFVRQ